MLDFNEKLDDFKTPEKDYFFTSTKRGVWDEQSVPMNEMIEEELMARDFESFVKKEKDWREFADQALKTSIVLDALWRSCTNNSAVVEL